MLFAIEEFDAIHGDDIIGKAALLSNQAIGVIVVRATRVAEAAAGG
ncbi:hypothetical protein G5B46_19105 [Caulobacter sp. 602-2]|uniref:Uncharacterized protein n=1 Tax=Caulobacter sp. 602-2 TaxID=2710887 RepID=A0A6G4R1C9_9CAUL|nr:hypothetical protein [Caulobacter sp. 602-2]NGM51726.1 hypothetical protein [Caulobacter sp. 602-2]